MSDINNAEERTELINYFLQSKQFKLGAIDMGFAITCLTDFFNYLDEAGLTIAPKQ